MPNKSKMWWEQGYYSSLDTAMIIVAAVVFWGVVIGGPFLIMIWINCGITNCP